MKKVLPAAAVLLAALTLAGCTPAPKGQSATQNQTQTAIKAGDYSKALGLNQALLNADTKNAGLKAKQTQLKALVAGQAAFDRRDFDAAKTQYEKAQTAASGNAALKKAAGEKLAAVKQVQAKLQGYQKLLDQAQRDYAGQHYTQAQKTLTALLKDSAISRASYQDVYKGGLELQANVARALQHQAQVQKPTADSSSSTDTSAQAGASSNPAGNSAENQAVKGSDAITAADLDQARKDIQAAGDNPAYFSPADLQRAILKARSAGRMQLQPADWGK